MTFAQFNKVRKALEWVKEKIVKYPEKYNQGNYCGTQCCIAGWLDIYANGAVAHRYHKDDVVQIEALKVLGEQAELHNPYGIDLFSPDSVSERRTFKGALQGCLEIDKYLLQRYNRDVAQKVVAA